MSEELNLIDTKEIPESCETAESIQEISKINNPQLKLKDITPNHANFHIDFQDGIIGIIPDKKTKLNYMIRKRNLQSIAQGIVETTDGIHIGLLVDTYRLTIQEKKKSYSFYIELYNEN